MKNVLLSATLFAGFAVVSTSALVAGGVQNRGELDGNYCDGTATWLPICRKIRRSGKTRPRWCGPTPVEDRPSARSSRRSRNTSPPAPAKVVFFRVQNNAAEIEAMRSRPPARGGFLDQSDRVRGERRWRDSVCSEGVTRRIFRGYNLIMVVKASSNLTKLTDLKGKKVAHTSPSSNSGNMAPRALFPKRHHA